MRIRTEPERWIQVWPMGTIRVKGIRREATLLPPREGIHTRGNNQAQTNGPILALHLRIRLGTTRGGRRRNSNSSSSSKATLHGIPPLGTIRAVPNPGLLFGTTHIAPSLSQTHRVSPCISRRRVRIRLLSNSDTHPTKSRIPCRGLPRKAELCLNATMTDLCP